MKTKILLFLFFGLAISQAKAQVRDTANYTQAQKDSAALAQDSIKLEKKKDTLLKTLSANTETSCGAFWLNQPIGQIYDVRHDRDDAKIVIKPTSISISTREGKIQKVTMRFENDNGVFINKGPISVTNMKSFNNAKLFYVGGTSIYADRWIYLSTLVTYVDLTDRISYPGNATFILNKETMADTIKISSSPIDFFDVRAYSDIKGLSGEANGLAQTEANISFIGNTQPWNLRKNNYTTFFPYVSLGLSRSVFDSQFDTLGIQSFAKRESTDILKMMQYSNFNLRVETELFRYSRVHDLALILGHQLYSTPMSDTSKVSKSILTPNFYLSLNGTMFSFPAIKAYFKFPMHLNYMHDQPFASADQNLYFVIIPEVELIIDPSPKKPNDTEKTGMTIFARARYFDLPNFKGNNFLQLQLGTSIPISDFMK
jgi:hypothetical protein